MGAREAYSDIIKIMKITMKEVTPDRIFKDFLSEKAFDIHLVSID
jgi:hypothetical protein